MAPRPLATPHAWPQQAKSVAELRRLGMSPEWHELVHDWMKIAVVVETLPSDGESYIDVYAYIYNHHFREWRQFFAVKVRGAGGVAVELDSQSGRLEVLGTANNALGRRPLFTFDLAAVHDDR